MEHISYQLSDDTYSIYEEDFLKSMMDFEMYKRGIDVKDFKDKLSKMVLYSSIASTDGDITQITVHGGKKDE